MYCPKCGHELETQSHFWPDPKNELGVVQTGLPKDWYSYVGRQPQDGELYTHCSEQFLKIKNGDIYKWTVDVGGRLCWMLFSKAKTHRQNVKPIGGRWVQ
jgi:hypothetical protein